MKIHCSIYRKRYHAKPDSKETARIQKYNCLKPSKLELSDLIGLIEQGCTFRPCAINGSSDKGFISGQLVGLDIDNEHRVNGKKAPLPPDRQLKQEDAIALSKEHGFCPILVYNTFGNKPLHAKYRFLFCLNRAITDPHQWKHIYSKLAAVFGTYPDPACKNPARLFFGTNQKASYTDLEARVDADSLLADYVPPTARKAPTGANTGHQKAINTGGLAVDIITAVQTHDADFIRRATKRDTPIYFNNRADMFAYIYTKINLANLLNVSEGEAFNCIIPDHEDSDPSASVFRASDGKFLYKCQSAENCPTQGLPLTIKQLFEHVGDFRSEAQCIEFLRKSFNLHLVETDYSRQQKENIDEIIKAINSTDEATSFKAICPTAAKNTRYCQGLYTAILVYAKDHILPDTEGTKPFAFYMPIHHFLKKSEVSKSTGRTNNYIKLLIYHTLIEIVPFAELPKDVQKKLRAGQTNGYNVCQYYRIPSWTHPHMLQIEERAKKWATAGYRLRSISYEGFYRAEGEAVANWLYPQRKYKRLSAEADTRHDFLVDILLKLIQDKGYATEKDIYSDLKQALKERGYTYNAYYADRQCKVSITEACNTYGLTRRRCNADLKARFGISAAGYPTIIYKD